MTAKQLTREKDPMSAPHKSAMSRSGVCIESKYTQVLDNVLLPFSVLDCLTAMVMGSTCRRQPVPEAF
jgi:hypothetical protein